MTTVEIALGLTIIGLLGVGGGKLLATKEIKEKLENTETDLLKEIERVQSITAEIQRRCQQVSVTCRAVRIEKEHELDMKTQALESELRQRLKNMEARQIEVFDTLKETHKKLNDQGLQLSKLLTWLEKNGLKKS